ncbi:MAG: DUF2141 domain-containing protein [Nitrospirae bacterium]|nr:DUF2141 domain-containing protein [Nitrospirota bacterium]
MTKNISLKAWILICCLTAATAWADAPQEQGDLVVHVSGFNSEQGQAIANLFRTQDDIFGKPYVRVVAPIQQGKASLIFPQLPYGVYAVTAFHDENGNNELDHNVLRLPAEPLGFSNGFKLSIFSGMPSFEKLRFTFAAVAKPLEITLK